LEVAAVQAFSGDEATNPERPDILRALNRMSSAVYVLMLREQTGKGTP
jgi:ethanolamine utilization cobalamin adenosyltransferase